MSLSHFLDATTSSKELSLIVAKRRELLDHPKLLKELAHWSNDHLEKNLRQETLEKAKSASLVQLQEAFLQPLSFGTGGVRARVGVGKGRINPYTVTAIGEGLGRTFAQEERKRPHCCVIGYDIRQDSFKLAQAFARGLERALQGAPTNTLRLFLFATPCPTPLLSYATRHFEADAGVMITASHNPPSDNGVKIYGADGGQLSPPDDAKLAALIELDDLSLLQEEKAPFEAVKIKMVESEIDQSYLKALAAAHQIGLAGASIPLKPPSLKTDPLKVLFSNLHGTGARLMERVLKQSSTPIHFQSVEAQEKADGRFPTVKAANPEEPSAMAMGLKELRSGGHDLFFATDPDADRLGIICRKYESTNLMDANNECTNSEGANNNDYHHLSGQEVAILLCEYCLSHYARTDLGQKPLILKSIVTSELLERMALRYQAACHSFHPGFKHIARYLDENQNKKHFLAEDILQEHFLLGAEESCGYLLYPFTRDKDALQTALVFTELTASLKQRGRSPYEWLLELYDRYGLVKERLVSLTFETAQEIERLLAMAPPKMLLGERATMRSLQPKSSHSCGQSLLDPLVIETSCHRVLLRPSGTEPKLKIYLTTRTPLHHEEEASQTIFGTTSKAASRATLEIEQELQGLEHTLDRLEKCIKKHLQY